MLIKAQRHRSHSSQLPGVLSDGWEAASVTGDLHRKSRVVVCSAGKSLDILKPFAACSVAATYWLESIKAFQLPPVLQKASTRALCTSQTHTWCIYPGRPIVSPTTTAALSRLAHTANYSDANTCRTQKPVQSPAAKLSLSHSRRLHVEAGVCDADLYHSTAYCKILMLHPTCSFSPWQERRVFQQLFSKALQH